MDEDVVYERTVKSLLDGDSRAGRKSRQDRIEQEDRWREGRQHAGRQAGRGRR